MKKTVQIIVAVSIVGVISTLALFALICNNVQPTPDVAFARTNALWLLFGTMLIGGSAFVALIASTIFVLRSDASEAKEVANNLLSDLRRLAMVAERTTNAVVLTDEHRKIVWTNEGFTRLTGYTAEEARGKSPGSFLQYEKTERETVLKIRDSLSKNEGFCGEILNRSKNGREYWVYIDVQPLFNDQGTHIGFLAIESDVTTLKQTTQALAEAREQTEFALDGGKLSVWQWDLDSNTMLFDQRFYQITRCTPRTGSQDGNYWLSRIHSDDVDQFNSIVDECISGSRSYFENQFRLLAEDGSYLWLMARGRVAGQNESGKGNRLMGTLVEVTARKLAEEALRESEAKASAIFSSSIDAIMLLNELRVVDCNQPAVAMFGFSKKEELLGVHINDLTPEIQLSGRRTDQLANEINETLTKFGQARFEWTHLKCDGSKFEVDVSFSDLEIAGKPMQLSIMRDISKKKELERQLSQAQKLESIGQLAAGIAHEVNTPMQCVFSNVEYLRSALTKIFSLVDTYRSVIDQLNCDVELQESVRIAEKQCSYVELRTDCLDAVVESAEASNRVIEIVRAMKTMSHPGTTQLSVTKINSLIKDAAVIARNRWKYVAKFETELDESIGEIPLLPAQMSQVILNLIVNAADAIVEKIGSAPMVLGQIRARTYRSDDGIVVEISDSGIGMSDKTKERVFDPFFTTKDVGKGTGQGLAIAYDVVVRQHLGRISVDSIEGSGSTFRVWLPYQHAAILPSQAVDAAAISTSSVLA